MLSHDRVWAAIDALAERYSLSASGLAKLAGLDSTAFNKSKRLSADGRPRWPSTESISKIMEATGASLDEFFMLVEGDGTAPGRAGRATGALPRQRPTVPLVGCSAGDGGDSGGDAQDGAVNLAQKTPPIHLNQTSVLLHDGVPAAEHTYREALARCSAGAVPVKPLADDVVAKLAHTYLETWYDGERMAVKADRWDFRSAGASAAGCVFEPVHDARLTIVEPGSTTVADLVKGTATRGAGALAEPHRTTMEGTWRSPSSTHPSPPPTAHTR